MKALTLKQPWATLVRLGLKRFETRSQQLLHAGDVVAIHAAKTFGPSERAWAATPTIAAELAKYDITVASSTHTDLPRGTIIAVALVESSIRSEDAREAFMAMGRPGIVEEAMGDYSPGRWAFKLKVWAVPDPYIFARGRLGVWELPTGVERRVIASLQDYSDDLPPSVTHAT